ncbi:hypothetical protein OIDMADRAFT_24592 [Oidiodendron maius Zn]|uniref:Uncharacterized protein n=1 Tax=Oidiodendron maius (strain Zn) TaxID=913774 RepID=A0A0C3HDE2_OIDMZ|nr:hypothetical protein OIDMADRAFT_24592 [Oidiodendron maius Zn]
MVRDMRSGFEVCGSGRPPFDPCEPGTLELPDDRREKRPVTTVSRQRGLPLMENRGTASRKRHADRLAAGTGIEDLQVQSVTSLHISKQLGPRKENKEFKLSDPPSQLGCSALCRNKVKGVRYSSSLRGRKDTTRDGRILFNALRVALDSMGPPLYDFVSLCFIGLCFRTNGGVLRSG